MMMTVREAFEKGTESFNSHDIDGFADMVADDVVFRRRAGSPAKGTGLCAVLRRLAAGPRCGKPGT